MPGRRVRFIRDENEFEVEDRGTFHSDGADLVAPLEIVGPASVASLREAVRRSETDEELLVSDTPAERFDEEYAIVEPVSFKPSRPKFEVKVVATVQSPDVQENDVRHVAERYLARRHASIVVVNLEGAGTDTFARVTFQPNIRSKTVGQLLELGRGLISLLESLSEGTTSDLESIQELIRAGRADVLIGQYETQSFEAKSQPYRLKDPIEEIKLAQAVARQANAEDGGLLVIGLETKKTPRGDLVKKVRTYDPDQLRPAKYLRVIDRLVYPPIDGLVVEAVLDDQGRAMMLIFIPAQGEELKPFLVHGAIIQGKVEAAFISIVRRRGDESIPIAGASIHAMLVAGRRLLRPGTGARHLDISSDRRRRSSRHRDEN